MFQQRKIRTFFLLFLSTILLINCNNSTSSEDECDETNLYAGIEISSTSIKKTLLERKEDGKLQILNDAKTRQFNFGDNDEIDEGEETQILDELRKQLEGISRHCIKKERVYIAFSSGIIKMKGLDRLKASIIEKLAFPETNIEGVNYHVEAISMMMSLDHKLDPSSILFVDIGGSNTKLGIFDKSNNTYLTEELKIGTRSLEEHVRKMQKGTIVYEDISKIGEELIATEIEDKIVSNVHFTGKQNLILVGGICYSLADNLYPNRKRDELLTLNFEQEEGNDLLMYQNLLIKETVEIPNQLKYSIKQLYGGLMIIESLWNISKAKEVYFQDQISWMPGFINYKIKQ